MKYIINSVKYRRLSLTSKHFLFQFFLKIILDIIGSVFPPDQWNYIIKINNYENKKKTQDLDYVAYCDEV